jgi:hypothetical protein
MDSSKIIVQNDGIKEETTIYNLYIDINKEYTVNALVMVQQMVPTQVGIR